jgi:hypothetical protein
VEFLLAPLAVMWATGYVFREDDHQMQCEPDDVLTFTNNPIHRTITLHNSRTDREKVLSTRGLPAVHIHICMIGRTTLNIAMM